jgi:putative tryptophan/tyrosine transport system substrate-binding protein
MVLMRRREFIMLVGGAAAAWPFSVFAQQPTKVARIGYLLTSPLGSPEGKESLDAFRQGLRERGYVEGQNILIEYRAADEKIERFPGLATELAHLNVDLIVAPNTPAALAAKQATTTIPIVVQVMGDPVTDGLVTSLARPGGNITGLTFLGPELAAKRLDLLKQAVPGASRVAVLWHPGAYGKRTTTDMLGATEAAARTLAVELQFVEVHGTDEFEHAFSALTTNGADALFPLPSPMFYLQRRRIVGLATKYRLPSTFISREFVELGGLMAYGASINDLMRRSAAYVDKILKGGQPVDLPVEQPTKFELAINQKTAKELGLTIPEALLLGADEVIE